MWTRCGATPRPLRQRLHLDVSRPGGVAADAAGEAGGILTAQGVSCILDRMSGIPDIREVKGMGKNLRMRAARAALGLSQADLAERVGVTRQTINAVESGDYNPTIALCISICRSLGTTLDDLFWKEERP